MTITASGLAQLGQEQLLQVGVEHRPVGRGRDAHRPDDPRKSERAQNGKALPAPAGHRAVGPLAARASGVGARQVGARCALVDEDQALGGDVGGRVTPAPAFLFDLSLVPLGGAQRLLFCA
jgi:hypothetical protein